MGRYSHALYLSAHICYNYSDSRERNSRRVTIMPQYVTGTPIEHTELFFLFDSIKENRIDEIRALLGDFPGLVSARDDNGYTPLHFAIRSLELLSLFMDSGADLNARSSKDYTALHLAISEGCGEAAEALISRGADINAREKAHNIAPLHLAAMKGNREMVELLVSRGAEINIEAENHFTPLKAAAGKGFTALADYLRSKGGV
jgi:ankyrin repeat protein